MSKRTHLTQPDEALRQAVADDLRRLLTTAAEMLAAHQPSAAYTDGQRLTLARHLTDGTEPQHRQLLARMPRITRPTTRGEYALVLRREASA